MKISPELDRIIDAVAEAKMHFTIAVGMKPGPERITELRLVTRSTVSARELLPLIGGFDHLPRHIAVELRVCEMGVERLKMF